MTKAPLISTMIAVALIPIAFLFIHAFSAGRKKGNFMSISGLLAILGDLSISIGYMIYRSLGGKVGGSTIDLHGPILLYFIFHGLIALIVIIMELTVLTTGLIQWRKGINIKYHNKLAQFLFYIWWIAFLSGELFYVVYYWRR